MKNLACLLVMFLVVSFTFADIQLPSGFQAELWLTGLSDQCRLEVGPSGAWGGYVYVANPDTQEVLKVTGQGTSEVLASGIPDLGSIDFDLSGAYGGDMFISAPQIGAGVDDPVYRVKPDGQVSVFYQSTGLLYDRMTDGIAFGKGEAFGTEMYVINAEDDCLNQYSPTGSVLQIGSSLPVSQKGDDLVISGSGLMGNYAYASDAEYDRIVRIAPDGNWSILAPAVNRYALALGSGVFGEMLYGSSGNKIYTYDHLGNETLFALGIGQRGIDIVDDVMWVTSLEGELYKVTYIPEPGTLALSLFGLFFARRRKNA